MSEEISPPSSPLPIYLVCISSEKNRLAKDLGSGWTKILKLAAAQIFRELTQLTEKFKLPAMGKNLKFSNSLATSQ